MIIIVGIIVCLVASIAARPPPLIDNDGIVGQLPYWRRVVHIDEAQISKYHTLIIY
jgi:hypothetical protein